ncbi:Do family serine endopeptidase [Marinobacterium arenosum]|uniref:Do family serine endopeptidase n=1 Tax=Marinobacterium arenosum TaxID=2862496 RepID=UPI001C942BD5|nr:Do family serine endopeptidase [Marinobacterium arenosum]MBY4679137.1 Do family serine endopeptidase [Marinobacterium arenosum]
MRRLTFLMWPIVAGVLAAVLLLKLFPDLLGPNITTVEIIESQNGAQRPVGSAGSGPVSYADAVSQAAPAVVNIYTRTLVPQKVHPLFNDPFFRKFFDMDNVPQRARIESSLGSGVILSAEGYIVTNNHVIAGADSVVVALRDGREAMAEVVGSDPETDLAVLKVDLKELPSITLTNSENLQVGDVVLAIGNPFGVGQTVTMGIISATRRNSLGLSTYEDFIQTDAAINPGNSGGALINAYGQLIGINTAIFSKSGGSQGIGFAIPSKLAVDVMQDLIQHGRVIRGWLGIEIQQLTPQLAESFGLDRMQGLLVAGLFRNSPAHLAGLQPGDIMLSINGNPISNSQLSMNQIAQYKPGDQVEVEILRNGKRQTLGVTIGERPASQLSNGQK